MVIYRCLVSGRGAGESLITDVKQFAGDGMLTAVSVLSESDDMALGLRQGESQAVLYLRALQPEERASMAGLNAPDYCVAVSPNEETPEAVGLCWEVMTALNTFHPTAVWLSSRMYGEEIIRRVASIRSAEFSDGGRGFVLTSTEFAVFLERTG